MNSQYLLLLLRIPPHGCRIVRRSHFRDVQNVRFRLQTLQHNGQIFNESERELYLSWYPWEAWWSSYCPGRVWSCWRIVDVGNSKNRDRKCDLCADGPCIPYTRDMLPSKFFGRLTFSLSTNTQDFFECTLWSTTKSEIN